jgi:hypothetical protein
VIFEKMDRDGRILHGFQGLGGVCSPRVVRNTPGARAMIATMNPGSGWPRNTFPITSPMKNWVLALLLLAGSTAGAFAGNINGRWKTSLPSPDGGTGPDLFFTFAVKGDQLTGTVDSPMGANEIKRGKVNGSAFGFAIEFDGNAIEYKCQLVSDDEISMEVVGFGDGMKMNLTRAKDEPAKAVDSSPPSAPRTHAWWRDRVPGQRPYTVDSKKLPLISKQVRGPERQHGPLPRIGDLGPRQARNAGALEQGAFHQGQGDGHKTGPHPHPSRRLARTHAG